MAPQISPEKSDAPESAAFPITRPAAGALVTVSFEQLAAGVGFDASNASVHISNDGRMQILFSDGARITIEPTDRFNPDLVGAAEGLQSDPVQFLRTSVELAQRSILGPNGKKEEDDLDKIEPGGDGPPAKGNGAHFDPSARFYSEFEIGSIGEGIDHLAGLGFGDVVPVPPEEDRPPPLAYEELLPIEPEPVCFPVPEGSLFTNFDDAVVFNAINIGDYLAGTQYDALCGDDVVSLPTNAVQAAQAGLKVGRETTPLPAAT